MAAVTTGPATHPVTDHLAAFGSLFGKITHYVEAGITLGPDVLALIKDGSKTLSDVEAALHGGNSTVFTGIPPIQVP